MQCKRCKTFFKYDKYDGICPQCAYFNRPPGMEEVDLLKMINDFRRKTMCFRRWKESTWNCIKKYDSDKKPHKKKKRQKIMPDTFQIIWK